MRKLRIGLSACFFHADPERPVFKGRTLLYEEQSMTRWVMDQGALPFLLPQPTGRITVDDLLEEIDGLILQGGSDVSPGSYGEQPIKPEWRGDAVRDETETALIKGAIKRDLPVLGICRGLQIMNVALGGSLFQDISEQNAGALVHRDWNIYEKNEHEVEFTPGSEFQRIYGKKGRVNSVHHQGIKDLSPELEVEARSTSDGIIEAVRRKRSSEKDPFVLGVQWHPEFQNNEDAHLISPRPLIESFLTAIETRRR